MAVINTLGNKGLYSWATAGSFPIGSSARALAGTHLCPNAEGGPGPSWHRLSFFGVEGTAEVAQPFPLTALGSFLTATMQETQQNKNKKKKYTKASVTNNNNNNNNSASARRKRYRKEPRLNIEKGTYSVHSVRASWTSFAASEEQTLRAVERPSCRYSSSAPHI